MLQSFYPKILISCDIRFDEQNLDSNVPKTTKILGDSSFLFPPYSPNLEIPTPNPSPSNLPTSFPINYPDLPIFIHDSPSLSPFQIPLLPAPAEPLAQNLLNLRAVHLFLFVGPSILAVKTCAWTNTTFASPLMTSTFACSIPTLPLVRPLNSTLPTSATLKQTKTKAGDKT